MQSTQALVVRMIAAIREGDDEKVEQAVLALSHRSRYLAPLALVVGAFTMLFQGVQLLMRNWRLILIQIVPAMWIWVVMLDLHAHVLHGKGFRTFRGGTLFLILAGVVIITAVSFYLNAVFAFSISSAGEPDVRKGFALARQHLRTVLLWGSVIGVGLGCSAFVVDRFGKGWFAVCTGIMAGILMFTYVAIPARLLGVKPNQNRRDRLAASAIGGAIGAVICSPPYLLGRVAVLLLGSRSLRPLAVIMLIVAIMLQTGATSAVKAVKMSAKLIVAPAD